MDKQNSSEMTMANQMPSQWNAPSMEVYSEPKTPAPRASVGKTILLVLGPIVGYLVVSRLSGTVLASIDPQMGQYKLMTFAAIPLLIFYVCMIVFVMKKKKVLTAKGNGFGEGLITAMFWLYVCASSVLSVFLVQEKNQMPHFELPKDLTFGSEQIWCIFAVLLSAGICEELMCRGLILNALRDRFGRDTAKGTILAIALSGVIFGCIHFINLLAGVSFQAVIIQVLGATGMGFYLGTVYCRCGNIKVTIFLHFLMDICVLLPASMSGSAGLTGAIDDTMNSPVKFLGIFLYTGLSAFLLRPSMQPMLFKYSLEDDK